jgi:hypothetical protein
VYKALKLIVRYLYIYIIYYNLLACVPHVPLSCVILPFLMSPHPFPCHPALSRVTPPLLASPHLFSCHSAFSRIACPILALSRPSCILPTSHPLCLPYSAPSRAQHVIWHIGHLCMYHAAVHCRELVEVGEIRSWPS